MAIRVTRVVSDNSSQEVDELRRQFNNLLLVLENVAALRVATTIDAAETWTAIRDALQKGVDETNGSYVGTTRELLGVRPTPTHPRRARSKQTEAADSTSDF